MTNTAQRPMALDIGDLEEEIDYEPIAEPVPGPVEPMPGTPPAPAAPRPAEPVSA